jgi:hypothetical protein
MGTHKINVQCGSHNIYLFYHPLPDESRALDEEGNIPPVIKQNGDMMGNTFLDIKLFQIKEQKFPSLPPFAFFLTLDN